MRPSMRYLPLLVLLLSLGFPHVAQSAATVSQDKKIHRDSPTVSPSGFAVPGYDGYYAAMAYVEQTQEIAAYVESVAVDEFLQSLYVPPPPVAQYEPPPTENANPSVQYPVIEGSCGGATNGADQFIARESGGNPDALNPSGAWGCYQIMPGTWAGAGCDDLGSYGSAPPTAQAACASRLPLSAWGG